MTTILLHGLGRSRYAMFYLERGLAYAGFQATSLGYPSLRHTIPQLAGIIWQKLETGGYAREPLFFVTHSMGSIVLRQLAASYPVQIRRAVMLAPPNQGTELSDLFNKRPWGKVITGKAGAQLGTDPAAIVHQLGPLPFEAGIIAGNRPDNPLARFILPRPNDGRIAVKNTRVEGMRAHLTLPRSHFMLQYDRKVLDLTAHFLKHGTFT